MTDYRLHRGACPHGRPPQGRRLDIEVDYGAFPVWTWGVLPAVPGKRPEREVHGMAGPRYLGLSDGLATDLRTWAEWHDHHVIPARQPGTEPIEGDWDRWRTEGRALADRLADETGDEVFYLWSRFNARDPECPNCRIP